MAGSFFHLWLAQRIYDDFWGGRDGENGVKLKGALGAGSLAPDLGLFPGGPMRLSERIHRERSGDFLRALLAAALSEEETAFVMGWGMHLYADWAVHPWVDERAGELFARTGEGSADLWHMRVEWGVDGRLLEREEWDYLWSFPLHFPRPGVGEELLSRVGRAFYGEDADPVGVRSGAESIERWMGRLPRIFLWCGKIHPRRRRAVPLLPRLLNRLTEKILGGGLAGFPAWKTESALAKPWHPQRADLEEVEGLGEVAIQAFKKGWGEKFASFPNRDLEREGFLSAIEDE